MKALRMTGYGKIEENLEFQESAEPAVGENDVLIDIHGASVNPIDYKMLSGAYKNFIKLDMPAPIGYDVSGKVLKTGAKVTGIKEGDEVFSRVPSDRAGGLAERIAVDANAVAKKPAKLSFDEAASIPLVGLTTYQALEKAGIKKGDKVLIHAGSGGVGTFAVQYAKARGAYVYTTTSTGNVEMVKALGADRVIDYKTENYLDVVKDLDIVFDTLGGQYTLDAFSVIKDGAKVVSIAGEIDGETARELGLNGLIRFILALKRSKITKKAKAKNAYYKMLLMNPNGTQLADIGTLIDAGKIKAVVDKTFPFEQSVEALSYLYTGRAKGKVVVNIK